MSTRKHSRQFVQTRPRRRWQIDIADQQTCLALPKKLLRQLVITVLTGENRSGCQISLALVNDQVITELHQRFLGLATPTDVLTFPLGDEFRITPDKRDELSAPVCGEIVVSTETALRQARQRRHDPATEALLYIIHGLLHLCGYDDTTPLAHQHMQRRQLHYLRQLALRLRRS